MTERTFTFRADDALFDALDAWRREQTVPPSRGAAIRYLIERGIEAERERRADDRKPPIRRQPS